MARFSSSHVLFDEVKTVSISFLRKHGYLKPNQWQSGTMTWSINGSNTGSISIRINTQPGCPYLELDYKCNETPICYRVQLFSVPSNLGKGVVWYFVCPRTGKSCRKLYFTDNYFYHRSAFNGLYKKQTRSKRERNFDNTFGAYFKAAKLLQQMNEKHFKREYAGVPTKKYLKLIRQAQRTPRIAQ